MKSQAKHANSANSKVRNSEINCLIDVVDHLHAACSKAKFLHSEAWQAMENEEPDRMQTALHMVWDYLDEIQGIKEVIETKFAKQVQS